VPLRAQAQLTGQPRPSAAWARLGATGSWQAAWDRATGVPSRIWGSGLPAPGASASAVLAEAFARAALADHLALLAPGSSLDNFALVSNHSDGDQRSVGFVQRHAGQRVVGGQISFRFKHDRLFVIASQALPDVALPASSRRARLTRAALGDRAAGNLRRELALPDAPVSAPGDEVVLPLIGDDAILGYRAAVPVTIDGGADGRYLAYADPSTGETLAVRQMNLYASATLSYLGIDRYPEKPRVTRVAPFAHVSIDGTPVTTGHDGRVSFAGPTGTVTTSVLGDLVTITNRGASGSLASAQLAITDGGTTLWDASAVPEDDAQVQVFLDLNLAKDFVRTIDPGLAILDQAVPANVNIAQDCNAFFDGKAVNFFHATKTCQNTGLLQDVVFHEFGHAVHTAEIIDGVGSFDSAMSEGAADFLAAQITNDSGMGRGFYYSDDPLRELDPPDRENRWPEDIGEIHKTGIIFGGAFWDLRKALIASLGQDVGVALTERLYIGALRRSTGIPDSLIEVLATDDDDGDLSNGTPHECEIRAAWGRHGLRTASGKVEAPATLAQPTASVAVRVVLTGLSPRCAGDEIDHSDLVWKSLGTSSVTPGSVTTVPSPTDPTVSSAQMPVPANVVLLYQVQVKFVDGSVLSLPDNLADPFYQLYEGRTVPLYCTDFEAGDPLTMGWTTGANKGTSPWAWGSPASGSSDPHAAFSGSSALIQALDGDYAPSTSSFVAMPPIDVGRWTDVHLQYRRWLAVEDSQFDQAQITVGGQTVWQNATQGMGDASSLAHLDREWRFQDVAVSGYQAGHVLDIRWSLTADPGLEFGGWALDDVCVVANAAGVCGDGLLTIHEQCDDGADNADQPNACRTWCQLPMCGDGIVDDGEDCDHGTKGDGQCTPTCAWVGPPSLGGCCQVGGGPGGALALAMLTLGAVRRRRR
ncbi:MAG TPA: hypothetical protein VGC42_03860, partial [Kofleriaceae bacterium]